MGVESVVEAVVGSSIGLTIAVYMLRWGWKAFSEGKIGTNEMKQLNDAYETELRNHRNGV